MCLMWAALLLGSRHNTWLLIKLTPKAWSFLFFAGWLSHVQCKDAVASALTQASSSHMPKPRKQHIPCASVCDMSLADSSWRPELFDCICERHISGAALCDMSLAEASRKPKLAALRIPVCTLQISLHALQFCIVPCIASRPNSYMA